MTTDTEIPAATAFAAEFPATEDAWRKAAEAALKGKPLEPVLRRRTMDGLTVEAILPRREAAPIVGRAPGARWIAMTRLDVADPAQANAQALEDLNNGASGLSIVLASPGDGVGVVADTLDRLDQALDGVMLDLAPVHLDVAPYEGRITAATMAALVERRGHDAKDVTVLFGVDLLRDLAVTGAFPKSWPEIQARFSGVVKGVRARGFTSPVAMIDGRLSHNAGASEAQELAGALAGATDHIRGLMANGIALDVAADAMSFALAVDAEQFASIAKIRALRLLWAAWRREAGLDDRPVHIHAETSRRMMTRRDPQTNLVRTTIAAFAAGVGGADSLTVLPYTYAIGPADADARRLARNAQAIVIEESHAARVADPAAGAGAIEQVTDGLASLAWDLFREIERDGGLFAELTSGAWQRRIAETRDKRFAAVESRKIAIVGVSEFPKADEPAPHAGKRAAFDPAPSAKKFETAFSEDEAGFDAIVAAIKDGATVADVRAASAPQPSVTAKPLDPARLSVPFERLRAENDGKASPPAVFIAPVGPLARHSARAGFVRNLMAAGGVRVIEGPVGETSDALAAAFASSGADIAVISGADADYAEGAAGLAEALAKSGTVWLAGRPKEGVEALTSAGVTRFVAAGDDAIEILVAASSAAKSGGA